MEPGNRTPTSARCRGIVRLAAFALLLVGSWSAQAAEPAPPAHDPSTEHLAYADDAWLVWLHSERIVGAPGAHAQSSVRTYSTQRVGETGTHAVLRTRGPYAHKVVTVLPDGTLGVTYLGSLVWARPDGPEPVGFEDSMAQRLAFDGGEQHVVRGTPRGLFLQDHRVRDYRAPVCFVPLEGRELRWERRVTVTKEPVSTQMPPYPIIEGDLLVCGRSVLHLGTDERRELDLEGLDHVRALGDGWAATAMHLVHTQDGRRTEYPDSRQGYHQVFAIRGGLAYAAHVQGPVGESEAGTLSILALDVTGAAAPREILSTPVPRPPTSFAHMDRGQALSFGRATLLWDRAGFWLFDGSAWRRILWNAP